MALSERPSSSPSDFPCPPILPMDRKGRGGQSIILTLLLGLGFGFGLVFTDCGAKYAHFRQFVKFRKLIEKSIILPFR